MTQENKDDSKAPAPPEFKKGDVVAIKDTVSVEQLRTLAIPFRKPCDVGTVFDNVKNRNRYVIVEYEHKVTKHTKDFNGNVTDKTPEINFHYHKIPEEFLIKSVVPKTKEEHEEEVDYKYED